MNPTENGDRPPVELKHRLLRRWPWFAVGILFLTTLLSLMVPAWQQARVIAHIQDLGGQVQTTPGRLSEVLPREVRVWAKKQFGRNWMARFDTVYWVVLDNTKATDDDLIPLKRFTELQSFYAAGANLSDEGLAHLKGFENLQVVWVYGNRKITDRGLRHLDGLSQLKKVNMGYTATTRAGVARFEMSHPNCEVMAKHLEEGEF